MFSHSVSNLSVQSLSCVQLLATPWTAAHQAPLSFTISWNLLKFMSIELVMLCNHLIFCCLLLHLPSVFPSIRVFSKSQFFAAGGQSIGVPASAAAAAAKSLQSCPTLCDPIDNSPPGSSVPGILQAKNPGVGCHFLLQCVKVKVKSLSRARLFATSWTAAHQAPPSMGFSRQEYWSGVPLPSPFSFSISPQMNMQD